MNFLNKFFPGIENKPKYIADKGDQTFEITGGPMRSVPITFVEEPVAVEQSVATERSALELPVENVEAVEAVEAEKPAGYVLSNVEFKKQKNAFLEELESKAIMAFPIDVERFEIIAKFKEALELMRRNKREIFVQSSETKDIWQAMADKALSELDIKEEWRSQVDVLLRWVLADVAATPKIEEQKIGNPELDKNLSTAVTDGEGFYETFEDKVSEIFAKSEFATDKEKAEMKSEKMSSIMQEWNNKLVRYEDNKERSDELLTEFEELKKDADALMQEVSSWKVAAVIREKKKITVNRGENSLERVTDYIDRIKNARIEKIKNSEKGVGLIKIADVKTVGLLDDEKKKLIAHMDRANSEIMKAQAQVESAKRNESNEAASWVGEFEVAIGKIKRMTMDEFNERYDPRQIMESFNGDYAQKLGDFLHLHNHSSVDAFSENEKMQFEVAMKSVKSINDENSSIEVFIINGNTYKISKTVPVMTEKQDTEKENSKDKKDAEKKEPLAELKVLADQARAKIEYITEKDLKKLAAVEVFSDDIRKVINVFLQSGGLPIEENLMVTSEQARQDFVKFEKLIGQINKDERAFVVYNDKTYAIKSPQEKEVKDPIIEKVAADNIVEEKKEKTPEEFFLEINERKREALQKSILEYREGILDILKTKIWTDDEKQEAAKEAMLKKIGDLIGNHIPEIAKVENITEYVFSNIEKQK